MPFTLNFSFSPKFRLLLAFIAGILLTSTAAYIGFGVYIWIGLIPLFFLIRTATSYSRALVESLIFLLAYNLCFFIWILGVHPLTWLHIGNSESLITAFLIWFLTAIFHSIVLIPVILFAKFLFMRNENKELGTLHIALIAALWVLITHSLILNLEPNISAIATPINQLVYSQYKYKELIQVSNVIGAIGFEYLIIFVNLLGLNALLPADQITKKHRLNNIGIIVFIFIAILSYGVVQIKNAAEKRAENIAMMKSFTIVQANYASASNEINQVKPMDLIDLQYQLSNKINQKQDFLFWAEGSVRLSNKVELQRSIFRYLSSRANVLVYGTTISKQDHSYNAIDFMEYKIENQMATGFTLQHYYKQRLAPFGEYTPFYNFLPENLKELSNKTIGKNYTLSSYTQPVTLRGIKIASSLCSELLFPKILRDQVREGADLMLNLNDLSWFKSPLNVFDTIRNPREQLGEDMLKKLFLAVATFRAIENKKDLLLVSNTGYSALLNSAGQVLVLSDTNRIALVQDLFLPSSEKSIYTVYSF